MNEEVGSGWVTKAVYHRNVLEDEKNSRWIDGAGPSKECSQSGQNAATSLLTFGQGEH